jgi:hypothetical protein
MKTTLFALIMAATAFAQLEPKEFIRVGSEPIGIEKMLGGAIKGAPYSGTITMESVQILADGNKISQKHATSVARDSQGRMRQEISLGNIPGLSPEKTPHMVIIRDPVAGESYTLDLNAKTYAKRKDGQPQTVSINMTPSGDARYEAKLKAESGARVAFTAKEVAGIKEAVSTKDRAVKQESLGMKVIEGVSVEGTRSTRTIAAGEIGNEKAIDIVSEIWISPDLKAVVYSKRSDPRTGDQIMQLTNIQRAEPPSSLFTVPADFTESKEGGVIRMRSNE